jgi:hypothetical protein
VVQYDEMTPNKWYTLQFVYYNFCRIHRTLRVTPAMEANIAKDIMTVEDIVRLAYNYEI